MPRRRITQAVVLIHGIGEQKPMDTLRGFVEAVLPDPVSGEKYFSKPDSMSQLFELRKLQNRKQPRTHFFEYYWASKVQGTKVSHVLNWLSSLLLRRPWTVPSHLKPLWWMTWGLTLASVGLWFWFSQQGEYETFLTNSPFWVSVLATLGLLALQFLAVGYVGDAARYLSPNPGNVALRQKIRSDGIELLRRLHASGKYERIVLAGHSLGSVIAYDIVTHLWQEMNAMYDKPTENPQSALRSLEATGDALSEDPSEDELREYQNHQLELWREMRALGNPWLVTDLITMGSPLAHAALLLAHDEDDLRSRQRQRELPTSPPVAERNKDGSSRYSYRLWDSYEGPNGKYALHALHHAALFAVTRWTNLYFPVRLGLFGDFVGGPLRRWFGRGILDRAVTHPSWRRRHTMLAHLSYWAPTAEPDGWSLNRLCDALDCDGSWIRIDEPSEDDSDIQDDSTPDDITDNGEDDQ